MYAFFGREQVFLELKAPKDESLQLLMEIKNLTEELGKKTSRLITLIKESDADAGQGNDAARD